jgi:predicted DNA-binding transcriptional regulator YafY
MSGGSPRRQRPAARVSLARASRLHRLVAALAESPRARERLLAELEIGLRTFYRELALLRRCGIRVRLTKKLYVLANAGADAAGRLPFPDPLLSFAEMAELARCDSPAGKRLADLLASVVTPPEKSKPRKGRGGIKRKRD